MKETVDALIEERAPWLGAGGLGADMARPILHRLLQYDRTLRIAETLEPMPSHELMQSMADRIPAMPPIPHAMRRHGLPRAGWTCRRVASGCARW